MNSPISSRSFFASSLNDVERFPVIERSLTVAAPALGSSRPGTIWSEVETRFDLYWQTASTNRCFTGPRRFRCILLGNRGAGIQFWALKFFCCVQGRKKSRAWLPSCTAFLLGVVPIELEPVSGSGQHTPPCQRFCLP